MKPNRNRFVAPATDGLVEDPRCSDAVFAAANPSLCPNSPRLVLKPEISTLCVGDTLLLVPTLCTTTETQTLSPLTFGSSNAALATVSAGGLVTALGAGVVTLSAAYGDYLAFSQITILTGPSCCLNISVASVLVLDNSRSMLQDFGAVHPTRLSAAKAMAASILEHLRADLDGGMVIAFNEPASLLLDESTDATELGTAVSTIPSTLRRTDIRNAFDFAKQTLSTRTQDRKVILLLSDGEHRPLLSVEESFNLLEAARAFKESGGIIICIGLRAAADGYVLLRNMATGGFFVNITEGSQIADAQQYLSLVMKQTCASASDYGLYFTAQVPDPSPLAEAEAYPTPWVF